MTEAEYGEVLRCEVCNEALSTNDNIVFLEDYTVSKDRELMKYKEETPLHLECVGQFFTGKFLSLKFDVDDARKVAESSKIDPNPQIDPNSETISEDQKYYYDVVSKLEETLDKRDLKDSGCSIAGIGELFIFIIYGPKSTCHMICDKFGGKTIMYSEQETMVTEPVSEFTSAEDVAYHLVDLIDPDYLDDETQ